MISKKLDVTGCAALLRGNKKTKYYNSNSHKTIYFMLGGSEIQSCPIYKIKVLLLIITNQISFILQKFYIPHEIFINIPKLNPLMGPPFR